MKQSAGLLLYRQAKMGCEVLLVHPGGPFWAKKDAHAWSAPKGEFEEGEEPLAAARREFHEELGLDAPAGEPRELGSIKQSGGKVVHLWALEADLDVVRIHSNTFHMEWPPKSGQQKEFPEVDRAKWCSLADAREKLVKGQVEFIDRLADQLNIDVPKPPEQITLL